MADGSSFTCHASGHFLDTAWLHADNRRLLSVIGVCNRSARGGGLGQQVKELENRAGEHTPVVVRSTAFPTSPKAKVVQQIDRLRQRGGRTAVVEDADWRVMLALHAFAARHGRHDHFGEWLRAERPLTSLPSLQRILGLGAAAAEPTRPDADHRPVTTVGPEPARDGSTTGPIIPEPTGLLRLGESSGVMRTEVTMEPAEMLRHTAFLGGTGSGKTTAALNLVEQLLLQGVPVLLVDRKGDLCGYARPRLWSEPREDPVLEQRRRSLSERVDVAVFSPGDPRGRPLAISVVPDGVGQLEDWERAQVADHAASALAGMMGYRDKGADASRRAVLMQAIALLCEPRARVPATLQSLLDVINDADPALMTRLGTLDGKHCKKLAEDLQTLMLNKAAILADADERLSADLFFGRQSKPGRTRLSVVSTKFLGDLAAVRFWVAQLLLEIGRWASRHPSDKLQAVVLLDEADLYLPATSKPATKEPLESLLKRARSTGVGFMLASQSPGDFDYKGRDNVRTWFLGRITQDTSLAKMKPVFGDGKGDVASKLPGQEPGEFHLVREGDVTGFVSDRSLLRTDQLAEDEILQLARQTARSATRPATGG
jgi:hypothetical protein